MVYAKGELLVRMKACLYGENPRAGLRLHSSHFDANGEELGFPGKTASMFLLENRDCFSGDLVFPVVLFVIQFLLSISCYLLIILIFHSYFPVVICDL